MQVIEKNLGDIKPYDKNAKKHDKKQIMNVAESIRQYGFKQPIVVDKNNIIIIGHCRALAAKQLGLETVPCVSAEDLTDEQVKALRLIDNKSNESDWDLDLLDGELDGLDLSSFNFDWDTDRPEEQYADGVPGRLKDMFIQPPFSVLDGRRGDWQKRKKAWNRLISSGNGRGNALIGDGLNTLSKAKGMNINGTLIFDPCLCEILLYWFTPRHGKIIDPFAGGSVRGIVSSFMDRKYYGVDLSKPQIDANEANYERIKGGSNLFNEPLQHPHWYNGDSLHIDEIIKEESFDGLLTCPHMLT